MKRFAACIALMVLMSVAIPPIAMAQNYPTLQYYVTDDAGVLLDYEYYDIETVCSNIYSETGAEMAVLIVNTTLPDGINIFAVKTFEKNGLGQEGEDNGLLLVVSTDEKAWRIDVGYGLTGVLPNSRAGAIGTEILAPALNQSLYYDGIYDTVSAIGQIIIDEYVGAPAKEKSHYPISFIPLTFWELVIVVGIILFLSVVTKGRIILWLPMFLSGGKGGKRWGGGRSGGGGAGGKF